MCSTASVRTRTLRWPHSFSLRNRWRPLQHLFTCPIPTSDSRIGIIVTAVVFGTGFRRRVPRFCHLRHATRERIAARRRVRQHPRRVRHGHGQRVHRQRLGSCTATGSEPRSPLPPLSPRWPSRSSCSRTEGCWLGGERGHHRPQGATTPRSRVCVTPVCTRPRGVATTVLARVFPPNPTARAELFAAESAI
jgi:hypothetical protein